MSIMAKTPSGYKKIGSAYLGERPVDKVFNANGDVIYALQRELTGVPPLLFKGKEQSELLNYRIYGDTVDGNSVGDLVESGEHAGEYKVPVTVEGKNLFDGKLTDGYHLDVTTGLPVSYDHRFATSQPITINQGEYCLTYNSTTDLRFMYSVFNDDTLIRLVAMMNYRYLQSGDAIDTTGGNKIYFAFYNNDQSHASTGMISNIMLNEGSTPLPYEPYHAPVTTPIYLPEPIKMVGDEAEYIDYAEQKLHRVRKNLFSTELEQGNILNDGTLVDSESRLRTKNYIPCEKGDYVLSFSGENIKFGCRYYDANYHLITSTSWMVKNSVFSIKHIYTKYIKLNFAKNNITENISPSDITDIQLEKGSTATEYEPYIENTDVDVTLPALPTIKGPNEMSEDTEVQPSRMDIKGRIKSLT